MTKVIISLLGDGGAGKTSANKHLHDTYGFTVVTISAVLREYAKEQHIELRSRPDYARTHAALVKAHGPTYLPNFALGLPTELLCIDDLRTPIYADKFREAGGVEVAFDCPVEIRFAHVRDHPDIAKYPKTLAQFIRNEELDEQVEVGSGVTLEAAKMMRSADYHIDASDSLAHTLEQLDDIVKPLLEKQAKSDLTA